MLCWCECVLLLVTSVPFLGGRGGLSGAFVFCTAQTVDTEPSCIIYRPVMDPDPLSAHSAGLALLAELLCRDTG